MSGRLLLDTNAVVALLNGTSDLASVLEKAEWIAISVITELEFLSFPGLDLEGEMLFQRFKNRVEVLDLASSDAGLLATITAVRKEFKVKLPDAIIAAMALHHSAVLVTNDAGFRKITGLELRHF